MNSFKVLIYKMGKIEQYDILPYFRNCWKEKYNKEQKESIKQVKQPAKRKQLFKEYIISRSKYMYWGRCEFEMLLASWPFGSYRMKEEMKKFLQNPINLDDYTQCLDFENIIIADMHKIDVHDQIMMNLDTIVDILYKEFKLDKKHEDSSNI
jgi:hypothetical protein